MSELSAGWSPSLDPSPTTAYLPQLSAASAASFSFQDRMGCWDTYCFFCSGPFADAYKSWKYHIRCAGNEVMKQFDEVAAEAVVAKRIWITEEDGEYWNDAVCIGSDWLGSFVSPPCEVGSYGDISFGDGNDKELSTDDNIIIIHRGCLSLACRWLDINPEQMWDTFSNKETPHPLYHNKRGKRLEYYDIGSRAEQFFSYGSIDKASWHNEYLPDFRLYMREVKAEGVEMEDVGNEGPLPPGKHGKYRGKSDCNWLLAAPTTFPSLSEPQYRQLPPSKLPIETAMTRALHNPDLFFVMLDWIAPHRTQIDLEEELLSNRNDGTLFLYESLRAILSLMQVNKQYYTLITRHRQDLFFRLVWQSGWMLPACSSDWNSWERINPPLPPLIGTPKEHRRETGETVPVNSYDWRAYLLMFVRKEDPHVKSRYRLRRMTLQFTRLVHGGTGLARLGRLGTGTSLSRPTPYSWEQEAG